MRSRIETGVGIVTLHRETIDAMGMTCSECGAERKQLYVFYTMRGTRRRTHNGQFCSKKCHDIFDGLKPRETK